MTVTNASIPQISIRSELESRLQRLYPDSSKTASPESSSKSVPDSQVPQWRAVKTIQTSNPPPAAFEQLTPLQPCQSPPQVQLRPRRKSTALTTTTTTTTATSEPPKKKPRFEVTSEYPSQSYARETAKIASLTSKFRYTKPIPSDPPSSNFTSTTSTSTLNAPEVPSLRLEDGMSILITTQFFSTIRLHNPHSLRDEDFLQNLVASHIRAEDELAHSSSHNQADLRPNSLTSTGFTTPSAPLATKVLDLTHPHATKRRHTVHLLQQNYRKDLALPKERFDRPSSLHVLVREVAKGTRRAYCVWCTWKADGTRKGSPGGSEAGSGRSSGVVTPVGGKEGERGGLRPEAILAGTTTTTGIHEGTGVSTTGEKKKKDDRERVPQTRFSCSHCRVPLCRDTAKGRRRCFLEFHSMERGQGIDRGLS